MKSKLDLIPDLEDRAHHAHYVLQELAAECQVSPRHMRRYIRAKYRQPAHLWLMKLKLQPAEAGLARGMIPSNRLNAREKLLDQSKRAAAAHVQMEAQTHVAFPQERLRAKSDRFLEREISCKGTAHARASLLSREAVAELKRMPRKIGRALKLPITVLGRERRSSSFSSMSP